MKHLKTYKIFEGLSSEIETTINDIALDINDEGCYIDYDINSRGDHGTVTILSRDEDYIDEDGYRDLGRFKVANIIPDIKRISDYLESEGYECMIICPMIFDKIESKDRSKGRYKDVTLEELEEYKDVDVMSVIIKLDKK